MAFLRFSKPALATVQALAPPGVAADERTRRILLRCFEIARDRGAAEIELADLEAAIAEVEQAPPA